MKTIDEMIDVMQRFKDGAKIECKRRNDDSDPWDPAPFPAWEWDSFDYRVKPVTKTMDIYVDPSRGAEEAINLGLYDTEGHHSSRTKKVTITWEE